MGLSLDGKIVKVWVIRKVDVLGAEDLRFS
jgi:hypothetical protein